MATSLTTQEVADLELQLHVKIAKFIGVSYVSRSLLPQKRPERPLADMVHPYPARQSAAASQIASSDAVVQVADHLLLLDTDSSDFSSPGSTETGPGCSGGTSCSLTKVGIASVTLMDGYECGEGGMRGLLTRTFCR